MITEEQRKFREGKIGASSAAACLGRSPFSTPAQEYARIHGTLDGPQETLAMAVGSHMEPKILEWYNKIWGYNAVPYEETITHPEEPRLICHCDGKDHDRDVLVEIKNVGPNNPWMANDTQAPEHVRIQACMQSMLDQTPRVDIVGYFGGNSIEKWEENFTEEDWGELYDGLMAFIHHVDLGDPPAFQPKDLKFLDKIFVDDGGTIVADNAVMDYANALSCHKRGIKIFQDKKKDSIEQAETAIKEFMGNNSNLVDTDGTPVFTWKAGKEKKVVDWEAVARNVFENGNFHNKEIKKYVDAHTSTNAGSRRFLCKLKG